MSFTGHKHTEEHKRHMSIVMTGRKMSDEARVTMSVGRIGLVLSDSHKAAIGKATRQSWEDFGYRVAQTEKGRRHAALNLPNCNCVVHRSHHSRPSKPQLHLAYFLYQSGLPVIVEKRFGRYSVDCYVPAPYHLAFEADGIYWHSHNLTDYAARDQYLFIEYGLPVIRVTEQEIGTFR